MELNTLISERLIELRAKKNLTYSDVGNVLNKHRETIRRYEKKPLEMSVEDLVKMLNLYDYDTNVFFDEIYGKMPFKN